MNMDYNVPKTLKLLLFFDDGIALLKARMFITTAISTFTISFYLNFVFLFFGHFFAIPFESLESLEYSSREFSLSPFLSLCAVISIIQTIVLSAEYSVVVVHPVQRLSVGFSIFLFYFSNKIIDRIYA